MIGGRWWWLLDSNSIHDVKRYEAFLLIVYSTICHCRMGCLSLADIRYDTIKEFNVDTKAEYAA